MRVSSALAGVSAILVLTACSVVTGSGTLATESRQVSGFTKVELSGTGTLSIQQTGTESLSISADDNVLSVLTSEVSGDTLVLGTKPNTTVQPDQPIGYTLTVKELTGIDLSGSATVNVTGLATAELVTEISGSGVVTVAGNAESQRLDISGSGRFTGDGLTSKRVDVQISGSGQASVHVLEQLTVDISGSGSLTYSGNPQVQQEISGSGRVTKK